MTNIETPEGWTPSGPCFTRVYDGRYAVIAKPQGECWNARVYRPERFDGEWLDSLVEAVAWANDKLGVPKPVEVVEIEFADGSVLVCDANQSRSARVSPYKDRWSVDHATYGNFDTKEKALTAARAYVRGDA